jgi:hypothetical protein
MSTGNTFRLADGPEVKVTWSYEPSDGKEAKDLWETKGKGLVCARYKKDIAAVYKLFHENLAQGSEVEVGQLLEASHKKQGAYLGRIWNDKTAMRLELTGVSGFRTSTASQGILNPQNTETFEIVFSVKASVGPDDPKETLSELDKDIEAKFVFSKAVDLKGAGQANDGSSKPSLFGTALSKFTRRGTNPDHSGSGMQPDSLTLSGTQGTAPDNTFGPTSDVQTANTGA